MSWATPNYSKNEVNRAGQTLTDPNSTLDQLHYAYTVINNWRASHSYPLNTFQIRLRDKSKKIDPDFLVAQRTKRLSSIKAKLEKRRGMKLAQIQDIGGCRAILRTISHVDELVDVYKNRESRGWKHEPFGEDDYIQNPQSSGYRSVHLVYKYKSDRNEVYNSLKIEIQIRTILQHSWATAVETIDTFTGQYLKGGEGEEDWKRFFALMSSAIALKEKRPVTPNTSDNYTELRSEIVHLERKLTIVNRLRGYRAVLDHIEAYTYVPGYFLLNLDPHSRRVSIATFAKNASIAASKAYIDLEEKNIGSGSNVVLVSVDSLESLKSAYPNYYADTSRFVDILEEVLSGNVQLKLFD